MHQIITIQCISGLRDDVLYKFTIDNDIIASMYFTSFQAAQAILPYFTDTFQTTLLRHFCLLHSTY